MSRGPVARSDNREEKLLFGLYREPVSHSPWPEPMPIFHTARVGEVAPTLVPWPARGGSRPRAPGQRPQAEARWNPTLCSPPSNAPYYSHTLQPGVLALRLVSQAFQRTSQPFARHLCSAGQEEACPPETAASPRSKTARVSYGVSCCGMRNCQALGM